jgi:quinol monooxygenase YgiN
MSESAPTLEVRHVVIVQVTVRADRLEAFERALLHNARESLRHDAGCLRFDVTQDAADPLRWVMHEVYDRVEAHAAHRRSAHFLAYDAVAAEAVVEKTVLRGRGVHIPA